MKGVSVRISFMGMGSIDIMMEGSSRENGDSAKSKEKVNLKRLAGIFKSDSGKMINFKSDLFNKVPKYKYHFCDELTYLIITKFSSMTFIC
jgi:hypothetical protein